MNNQQNKPLLRKQPIIVLSLAIFILIISGGYFYYRYEKKIIRQEQYNNLNTIADLKTSQIVHWREERLADADVFIETFIRQTFQQWLYSQDSNLKNELLDRLSLLRYYYNYEDVIIVSNEGKLLFSLDTNLKHIDSEISDNCKKALQEKKTFLGNLYFCPAHDTIHLDVFAPILSDKNVPVAVLLLRVNPFDFLYPLFQSWPTPSKSAETLIIRKDGDSVLYVNELRHISNTALKLRIPLTSIEVPAVQAVLGHTGIIEGTDYRGVRVLADMRPVTGSPWYMIAKIDQSEIFSELKYRTIIVIIITLLLLLFSGIGISLLYNNRQKNIYRKLLETGTALEETQIEFRTTLYSIGDAVITTDTKGCIRNMNVVAEKLTGWKEPDGVGRNIGDVFNIVNEESGDKVESPVQRVLKEGLVVGLANHTLLISKDGKEIPIADSGAPIHNEKDNITGVVLVFRDQTREREAQKALQESERKFRVIFESHSAAVAIIEADTTISMVNESYCKMSGYSREEVIGMSWTKQIPPDDLERLKEYNRIRLLNPAEAPSEYEFTFYHKNGGIKHAMMSVGIIQDIKKIIVSFIDISQRKQAEQELIKAKEQAEESERLLKKIAENYPNSFISIIENDLTVGYSSGHEFTRLNLNPEDFNGLTLEQAIGDYAEVVKQYYLETFSGKETTFDLLINNQYVHNQYYTYKAVPLFDEKNEISRILVVAENITERKRAEKLMHLQTEILKILTTEISATQTADKLVEVIKHLTGYDAVGLRLRTDSDYPFVASLGYSEDFLKAENTLLNRYPDGGLCKNADGNVSLECTCGLIISGKTDPSNPLFTPGGSAYTNNSLPFLDVPPEADPRLRPRNRCIHVGFLSFALIPIRAGAEVMGLLHLADRKQDQFTPEAISFYEGIGASIGVALARKQAKEALQMEKANLAAIFESSQVAMFILDETTNIVQLNAAAILMTGGSKSDILQHRPGNALRCIHSSKDMRGCGYSKDCKVCPIRNGIEALIANGGTIQGTELELELIRNGTPQMVWMSVGAETIQINGRRHVCVAMNDITDRKQAEQQIIEAKHKTEESEKLYKALFQNSESSLSLYEVIFDNQERPVDYRFLAVNSVFEILFGFKTDFLVGKTLLSVFPNTEPVWLETFRNVVESGKQTKIDNFNLEFDRHYEVIAYVPQKGQLALIGEDITLRKKNEIEILKAKEKAEESEEKFRVLIESNSVAIYLTDLNGKCTYVNPKWSELAHLTYNEALGDGWVNGIYVEDRDKVFVNWDKMIASDGNWGFEYRFGTPDKISWVFGSAKSYKNDLGQIAGFIGSNVDITERKQAEDKILNQLDELQRWNNITLGREDRHRELKREVNELLVRLGESVRYSSQEINNIIEKPPIAE